MRARVSLYAVPSRPRGATTLIAICLSYPGTHRLVAELKLPGCSRAVRPACTSFTVCRRNAGANCGRVLGIVAPFQSATCLRNWASRQQTVHGASIEHDSSRAIHSPRLVTLIPVSVHPSTPQKICTTSRGSTSSAVGALVRRTSPASSDFSGYVTHTRPSTRLQSEEVQSKHVYPKGE